MRGALVVVLVLALALAGCMKGTSRGTSVFVRMGAFNDGQLYHLPDGTLEVRLAEGPWGPVAKGNATKQIVLADAHSLQDEEITMDLEVGSLPFEARLTPDAASDLGGFDVRWELKWSGAPYFESGRLTVLPPDETFRGDVPAAGLWVMKAAILDGDAQVATARAEMLVGTEWTIGGVSDTGSDMQGGQGGQDVFQVKPGASHPMFLVATSQLRPGAPGQGGTDVDLNVYAEGGTSMCSRRAPGLAPSAEDSNETAAGLSPTGGKVTVLIGRLTTTCNGQEPQYHNVGVVPYQLRVSLS